MGIRADLFMVGIRFSFILLMVFNALTMQAQVKSFAYRTMLKTLLDKDVPWVSAEQAARDSLQALFLDAREPREYAVSYIKGARFVGYDHFSLAELGDIPRDTAIIIYCSVGYRSQKITEQLLAAGFTNVHNLYGGIFEWVNRGYPIYSAEGQTRRVHAYSRTWGIWLKKGEKVYD